jgi:hypothetical protein
MSEPEHDYTSDPNLDLDRELREIVEDFVDASEFGDLQAYLEQLDQTQINKLMTYLAVVAREAGLGVH